MKDDAVVLTIERLAAGGYGLARTDDGVVFVRGALPGERVTARPRAKSGTLKAHAIDILEPHPDRVSLPLPPGADLPLSYPAQLPIKEALVREALERIGKIAADVLPIAASPSELRYRTAAQYAVAEQGLGSRAPESDKIIPLEEDLLAADPINAAISVLSERSLHGVGEVAFRASLHTGDVLVGLLGNSRRAAERHARHIPSAAGIIWSELDERGRFRGRTELLTGKATLLEDFGGVVSTVSLESFSQVNPTAAGGMYREAAEIAGEGTRAIDLYAGGGVVGMHLTHRYGEVAAIDISSDAVKRGLADARRLRIPNIAFHRGDARSAKSLFPAGLVAVDPPRAGLGDDVAEMLIECAPQKVLYLSCDPATWARDAARFANAGYRLTFVRPYDFYPYTHHVEVLSLLER